MTTINTPNGFSLDNSGRRVVVDPVTRIEGHMRCEVNLDENNMIRNAVSTGTMWRGLEVICGVVTRVMHGRLLNGFAGFVPALMPSLRFGRWKMR